MYAYMCVHCLHVPGNSTLSTCNVHLQLHTHNLATICTHTVAPNFTVNPEDLLAVVGDIVVLTCSAQATPPPNITWEFGNGTTVVDDDLFNISFPLEGDETTTSVLSFLAREDLAGSAMLMFRCMATNDVGNATSDTATVTIQSKLSLCFFNTFMLGMARLALVSFLLCSY